MEVIHKQLVSVTQFAVNIPVKICVLQSAGSNIFMFHSKRGISLAGEYVENFLFPTFSPQEKNGII